MPKRIPEANAAARKIMEQLKTEAAKSTQDGPLRTVERFEQACDAILSGNAWHEIQDAEMTDPKVLRPPGTKNNAKLVKSGEALIWVDPAKFRPPHHVLDSVAVGEYARFKGWPGPVAVTVRKNATMMNYIEERLKPYVSEPKIGTRGSSHAQILRIIDRIQSPADKTELRFAYFAGRKAIEQVNLAAELVRKIAPVDLRNLEPGENVESILSRMNQGLNSRDQAILKGLVKNFHDQSWLERFGLTSDGHSIYMGYGQGHELISPEELALLDKHAGIASDRTKEKSEPPS